MKNTEDLILESSLTIFSNKGYNQTTTLEISKNAGVSEMTLFRHFKTKNNLFYASVKRAIGEYLIEEVPDMNLNFKNFLYMMMHEKLIMISKHIMLIKMLIRETLASTLPEEFEFSKTIYDHIIKTISHYASYHQLKINPIVYGELMVGLLLRFAVMEETPNYHLLSKEEQKNYLENYFKIINI